MPKYTENLNLILPEQNENYDVNVANTNNTLIDEAIGNKVEKVPGKDLSTNDFTDGYKKKIDTLNDGTKGDSAYQIAIKNGFEGTEQEWLKSIKGDTPVKGIDYFTETEIAEITNNVIDSVNINIGTILDDINGEVV